MFVLLYLLWLVVVIPGQNTVPFLELVIEHFLPFSTGCSKYPFRLVKSQSFVKIGYCIRFLVVIKPTSKAYGSIWDITII